MPLSRTRLGDETATADEAVDELLASHERYPSLFDDQRDPMGLFGLDGGLLRVNGAALRLFGYSADALKPFGYRATLEPFARPAVLERFRMASRGNATSIAHRVVKSEGGVVYLETSLLPAMSHGRIAGVYASAKDVTAQHRLEATYREQSERMRELYLLAASTGQTAEAQIFSAMELARARLSCDGASLARIDGDRIVDEQRSGTTATRSPRDRALAETLDRYVVNSGDAIAFDDAAGAAGPDAHAFIGMPILVAGDLYGTLTFTNATARAEPFSAADCDFARLVGALAASAIERGEQRRRLNALAFFDSLTGLPNRVLLADRLSQAIASAARRQSLFALHFYDLDGFKTINDRYGHIAGDDVLRGVAQRFGGAARDEDTVARVGGDEFVVVQPNVRDRADAEALASRLRKTLEEPFVIDGAEHRLTASAGIALFPSDGKEPATLLARADAALYRVKASGRDGISFALAGTA